MRDNSRYPAGTAYDPEMKQYYAAHAGASGSRGAVFSSAFGFVKNFDGLGVAPAILRFCPALSDNERPEVKTAIANAEIVERKASAIATVSKTNTFSDVENNFRIYPKSCPPFLIWERSGDNLSYSTFFDGRLTSDSTVVVEVEAVDHYGSTTTATFTLIIKPRIYTPRISTPLTDQIVAANATDLSLPLDEVFEFFPANVGVRNLKTIAENTRPELLTAVIDEVADRLILSFTPGLTGKALLTLRGTTIETTPDNPDNPESKYVEFSITVTVGGETSILSPTRTKSRVYPTLTRGEITVELFENETIDVYSIAGAKVKTLTGKPGPNMLDLRQAPRGVYFVRTESGITKIILYK